MPKYIFSGVVHPERATVNMGQAIHCRVDVPEAGVDADASIEVYKNQIIVALDCRQAGDPLTLRNIVADLVSSVMDGVGLGAVVGYEVEIKSVHDGGANVATVFGADVPGLSIGNNETRSSNVLPIFTVAGKEPLFRRALADFRLAIRHPVDTGFYCYRAVESLTHFVKTDTGISDKIEAIRALETALNLDQPCIELLRDLGGGVRHGQIGAISGEDRINAIRVTQEILMRFFQYLTERDAAAPQFSLLTL